MSKKKNELIRLEKREELVENGRLELILRAAWESIAVLLLFNVGLSSFFMVSDQIKVNGLGTFYIVISIVGTIFYYECTLPFLIGSVPAGKKVNFMKFAGKWGPAFLATCACVFYHLRYFTEIRGGFLAISGHMMEVYNRLFHANVAIQKGLEEGISLTLCFYTVVSFFAVYFLTLVIGKKWLFCLFPMFYLIFTMYVGIAPKWSQILILVAGTYMLTRDVRTMKRSLPYVTASLVCLVIIGIAVGFLLDDAADSIIGHSQPVKEYQKKVETKVQSAIADSLLSREKYVVNDSPKFKGTKIMMITLDEMPTGNLYLLDFLGTNYDRGAWKVSKKSFSEVCAESGTDAKQASLWLTNALFDSTTHRTVLGRIKYQKKMMQNMYLPYGTNSGEVKQVSYRADTISQKSAFQNSISFESWNTNDILDEAWQFRERTMEQDIEEDEEEFWNWHDAYVKDSYLSIPDYAEDLHYLDDLSLDYYDLDENLRRVYLAQRVSAFLLSGDYVYDWDLDSLAAGEDPIEYFVTDSHKGYCIHFASAGVLLLRKLGVPARYATGYLLKPNAFEEQKDGSFQIQVLDRNGHAWAEIYLNGIGWIPVEMTPDNQEDEEREDQILAGEDPTDTPESREEEMQETDESQDTEAAQDGLILINPGFDIEDNEIWFPVTVTLLLILLVLLLIIVLRRNVRGKRIQRAIKKQHYKIAVKIMNQSVYKRLWTNNMIRRGKATDRDIKNVLLRIFGEGEADQIEKYSRVTQAAAFSEKPITKEECILVWYTYHQLKTLHLTGKGLIWSFKKKEKRNA